MRERLAGWLQNARQLFPLSSIVVAAPHPPVLNTHPQLEPVQPKLEEEPDEKPRAEKKEKKEKGRKDKEPLLGE